MKTISVAQAKEFDHRAQVDFGVPSIVLMENAGRSAAEVALKMLWWRERAAVVCGVGNNGGDGFVVARHLHNHSISVYVFLVAKISDILKDGDAGTNLQILLNMKIPVKEILDIPGVNSILKELNGYNILADALFGTGLSGDVREPFKTLISGVNNLNKPTLSVDIPSGLDCNTGKFLGAAIKATKTVTFAVAKKGFYLNDGPSYTGKVIVSDISIPRELIP